MRLRIVFLMMCLLLVALPAAQAQDQADWTLIVYFAGDNDLESFLINDLIEIQAGAGDNVNVVVQVDRAEGYEDVFGDWTDARRYVVAPGANGDDFAVSRKSITSMFEALTPDDLDMSQDEYDELISQVRSASNSDLEEIALQSVAPPGGGADLVPPRLSAVDDLGEVNMGEVDTLVDFVTWAMDNYPADHYGLSLWDHGGGWTMIGADEADEDQLDMLEVDAALAEIIDQTNIEKFDFIAFDACLMAQLEVFAMLAPYANYAIASEETIPGAGWEYTTPLQALNAEPDMSTTELGETIVDSYMTFYTDVITDYPAFDLGIVDLSETENVIAALDTFSQAVAADPEAVLGAIGDARNNAQMFAADSSPDEADAFSSVDLIHFMKLLAQLSPDETVADAAQGVVKAAWDMIVYSEASDGLPNANGIAIFFPRNIDAYDLSGGPDVYAAANPAALQPWYDFLSTFHGTAVETLDAGELSVEITDLLPADTTSSIYDPPVVIYNINGQQIMSNSFFVTLLLDDGTQYIVDTDELVSATVNLEGETINDYEDGLSTWEFTWNVEMPIITDGEVEIPILLLPSDQENEAIISGEYLWKSGRSQTAYLIMDTETAEVVSVWGVNESGDNVATSVIRPAPGDEFRPTWRFIDENGETVLVPTDDVLTFSREPFTYYYVPAYSGDYELTILVEDVAGNVSLDTVPLSVDNEELDTDYRGFKDVSFGINFLYPWTWTDPTVIEDDEGSVTLNVSDETGAINIYIEAYEVETLDELLEIKLDEFSYLEDFEAKDPEVVDLNGYESYYIDYTYTTDGDLVEGWLALVLAPENGLGYSLDLDAPEERLDEADAVFSTMLDSLSFFEPYQE